MIKINDTYSFEREEHCWRLHETRKNTGLHPVTKQPGKGFTTTTTYHSTVMQICNAVIDKESGTADSLEALISTINNVKEELVATISSME